MGAINECIPYYEPGQRITGAVADPEAPVAGKTFVMVADDIESGPGLSDTAEGGNIVIETATAGDKAIGVASTDSSTRVTVIVGGVVPVVADGAITAGEEVEVGTDGAATAFSTGRIVGMALTGAADAEDAMILLYQAVAGPEGPTGPSGP